MIVGFIATATSKELKVSTKKTTRKAQVEQPAQEVQAEQQVQPEVEQPAQVEAQPEVVAEQPEQQVEGQPETAQPEPAKVIVKTKADIAREIMNEHFGKKTRKEIMQMFIADAGLTVAGANTYYANVKKQIEKRDA